MGIERICLKTAVLLVIVLGLAPKSKCIGYLSDNVKISKCCPQGRELKVITDESGIVTGYECDITRADVEKNQTFFGYNLETTDESQIPDCDDVKLFDFDVDGGLISSGGCIDMYNGILHGLTCSDKFQIEVHKLLKCCAEGRTEQSVYFPLN